MHLERIARLNGPINALVVVDRDGALKAARAADRARAKKNRLGPLHGVPITIKEAFDVAGLHTTSSHPPLKDNVALADASLVARLRAAGAVILGKTNVPELCADFQTDSPLFGTSKNAWDARRTAGGSTGGGGGRRRGAPVAARARQRHRRLGPQSRALQRHLFAEAHRMARARPRPCAGPAGPDPYRPLDGRVRPAGALGRGPRDGAAHHRRTRRPRRRGRAPCRLALRRPPSQRTCASRSSTAIRW